MKQPSNIHPNSLANLIRVKKGQVLNPTGGKKALMTKRTVEETFQRLGQMSPEQLLEISSGEYSAFEKSVAATWLKAIATGDMQEITRILDRAVGKVKDESHNTNENHNHDAAKEIARTIPTAELIKLKAVNDS